MFLNPILRGFENAKRYKIRNKKVLFLNPILGGGDPILRGVVPILRWLVPSLRGFVPNLTLRGVVSPILRWFVPILRGFVPNLTLRGFVTVCSLRVCVPKSYS